MVLIDLKNVHFHSVLVILTLDLGYFLGHLFYKTFRSYLSGEAIL